MLSQETIQAILGIKEKIYVTPGEMADQLNIVFFPYDKDSVSQEILYFQDKLYTTLEKLKVNIVPYEEAFEYVLLRKRFRLLFLLITNHILTSLKKMFGLSPDPSYVNLDVISNILKEKKIKKGISIVALGESNTSNLPMDNIAGFRNNSVITILDRPVDIKDDSEFHKHFDTAMNLFAHHMTNIVILVDKGSWIVYNFNASHPIYPLDSNFEKHVLDALIPKIVAPIKPNRFSEFEISPTKFDPDKKPINDIVEDLIKSGELLEKTNLYPPGKSIDSLPFRNKFYRWVGAVLLDHRNGMSYGFLAWQLPTKLSKLIQLEDALKIFGKNISDEKDYFTHNNDIYIIVHLPQGKFCLKVPEVWVLSQRSGSNKTKLNPQEDLVKLGLKNGQMIIETPKNLKLTSSYKPSFDTKVMLAHAVGNAIVGSILEYIKPDAIFPQRLKKKGLAMSHWHGYINPKLVPQGWYVYGQHNPHVSCSTPQSAIYALEGKLSVFNKSLGEPIDYLGDIHIEPHHGTNISFASLEEFGLLLNYKKDIATLGNKYLYLYE